VDLKEIRIRKEERKGKDLGGFKISYQIDRIREQKETKESTHEAWFRNLENIYIYVYHNYMQTLSSLTTGLVSLQSFLSLSERI